MVKISTRERSKSVHVQLHTCWQLASSSWPNHVWMGMARTIIIRVAWHEWITPDCCALLHVAQLRHILIAQFPIVPKHIKIFFHMISVHCPWLCGNAELHMPAKYHLSR